MQYSIKSARHLSRKPSVDPQFVRELWPVVRDRAVDREAPMLEALLKLGLAEQPRQRTVADAARLLGISPRTLTGHLRDEGFAPPQELLHACLVLRAANFLCHTDQTVEAVARRLGLSGAHALRRVFRRYLGLTPRALADPQQWRGVVDTFLLLRRPRRRTP